MSVKTLFAASALAASSLVSAAAIPQLPQLQQASSEQTCVGKNSGHKFVTKAASNVQYEVVCGADYYGSDLKDGLQWPGSFEGCLAACDDNAECKAVSWADGPCYLKGGLPTLVSGSDNVWTAKKNPAPTCEGDNNSNGVSYITSAGNFEIICGADYAGGDLPYSQRVNSFVECIDLCAADEQCADVSYEYGMCYPKKTLGDLVPKSSIWTAKFSGSRTGAAASPSATASSSPTPTPEAVKALTCVGDNNDNGKTYKAFEIQCGHDHSGADIGAYPGTTTFEECMDACEANGECRAVSWVWGACYMKNAANPGPTNVGHVWGAVRPSRDTETPTSAEAAPAVDDSTVTANTPETLPTSTPVVTESSVNSSNVTAPVEPAVIASGDLSSTETPADSSAEVPALDTTTSTPVVPASVVIDEEAPLSNSTIATRK